jgi:hypothetical protein
MNLFYEGFTAKLGWAAGEALIVVAAVVAVGIVMVLSCCLDSLRGKK